MGDGADLAAPRNGTSRAAVSGSDCGRVKELLHQAIALNPAERARFLDEVCGADTPLRVKLDGIVLKALERDRERRYGTPAELAADLAPVSESRARHRAAGERCLSVE